ncbi:hypothetical protein FrEUN1fDRAFT_2833 [Parafrankia sp. EUN1f]|nr:hypothetical protein FrEUN1fDRAFT_2833 [Parafrankia sp. EUN1f]
MEKAHRSRPRMPGSGSLPPRSSQLLAHRSPRLVARSLSPSPPCLLSPSPYLLLPLLRLPVAAGSTTARPGRPATTDTPARDLNRQRRPLTLTRPDVRTTSRPQCVIYFTNQSPASGDQPAPGAIRDVNHPEEPHEDRAAWRRHIACHTEPGHPQGHSGPIPCRKRGGPTTCSDHASAPRPPTPGQSFVWAAMWPLRPFRPPTGSHDSEGTALSGESLDGTHHRGSGPAIRNLRPRPDRPGNVRLATGSPDPPLTEARGRSSRRRPQRAGRTGRHGPGNSPRQFTPIATDVTMGYQGDTERHHGCHSDEEVRVCTHPHKITPGLDGAALRALDPTPRQARRRRKIH